MDHLRQAYASSDEGETEEKVPTAPALGELPPELLSMFSDSGKYTAYTQTSRRTRCDSVFAQLGSVGADSISMR